MIILYLNRMDDSTKLDVTLNEIFFLLGEAMNHLKPDQKSRVLFNLADSLRHRYGLGKEELKEAITVGGHDFKESQKVIVATRMVPVSQPEEMGSNGLMWRDMPK
jgi:hypothetical protein